MPKVARSLQACHECRKRKIRCDGVRPHCNVCSRNNRPCYWSEKLAPGGYRLMPSRDLANIAGNVSGRSAITTLPEAGNRPDAEVETLTSTSDLPPLLLQQRLLDIFLHTHHALELCGCVHKDTLKGEIFNNDNRFLLYSILALSAIYLTDVEAKSDPRFASSKSIRSYYTSKAQDLSRQSSDQPSVIAIQGNLVLGLCELLTMATARAWLRIGLAIRMAQTLRMRNEYNRRHVPRQREVRRRTFWACMVLDRLAAYCTFRTQTIDLTLVGLHLPCSEIVFAFGQDSTGPMLGELGRSDDPGAEMMTLAYFIKTFMLWSPIAQIYINGGRRRWPVSRRNPSSNYWKDESAMKIWHESLPPQMRWSENNLRAHQSLGQATHFTGMHFLIQHALFLVHHEYLPHIEQTEWLRRDVSTPGNGSAGISLHDTDPIAISACLEGSRQVVSMLRLIDTTTAESRRNPLGTCIGVPIVTAASVLLWVHHCSHRVAPPVQLSDTEVCRARDDVDYLVSILIHWAKHWALARAWANCVKLLDEFYQSRYHHEINDSAVMAEAEEGALTVGDKGNTESRAASPTRLRDGDGYPDVTMIPHETFYKVRLITGLVSEQPELCKKFLHMAEKRPAETTDQRLDPWEIDLDFSWMNDADLMATSLLWTDFMLPADQQGAAVAVVLDKNTAGLHEEEQH